MKLELNRIRIWAIAAGAWLLLVTAAFSPFLVAPHVEPMGVTFREDTSGVEFFALGGTDFAAIEAAVASGRLAAADLSDGFRVFMRGTLSKAAKAARIRVAQRVVDQHIGEVQWAARTRIAPLWAVLTLLPAAGLLSAGALITRNRGRAAAAAP